RETTSGSAVVRRRRLVAVQPRGVPPPLSGAVSRDGARDDRAVSAHAAVGAVPRSARSRQRAHDASIYGAPRAPVDDGRSRPMLSAPGAIALSIGAALLHLLLRLGISDSPPSPPTP